MKKVGFIIEKNDSPMFVRSHVHIIKESGFVSFRLSDDDFKIIYSALRFGHVEKKSSERLSSLLDLFQSIYSRI